MQQCTESVFENDTQTNFVEWFRNAELTVSILILAPFKPPPQGSQTHLLRTQTRSPKALQELNLQGPWNKIHASSLESSPLSHGISFHYWFTHLLTVFTLAGTSSCNAQSCDHLKASPIIRVSALEPPPQGGLSETSIYEPLSATSPFKSLHITHHYVAIHLLSVSSPPPPRH